jgi:hypothetical protein
LLRTKGSGGTKGGEVADVIAGDQHGGCTGIPNKIAKNSTFIEL